MEEWLLASSEVRQVLELENVVPDHSTISRAFKKLKKSDYEKMGSLLLKEAGLEGSEEYIASDSTGFSPTGASAYYQTRSGRTYHYWIRAAFAVGCHSQFILSCTTRLGPFGIDAPFLSGLRRQACKYGVHEGGNNRVKKWVMLADAGFDGRGVREGDLIPPIRRGRSGKIVDPVRKAQSDLVAQARLDGLYGQRWKIETVNSVVKRLFGSSIRSRKRSLQRREAVAKALVYNIHL